MKDKIDINDPSKVLAKYSDIIQEGVLLNQGQIAQLENFLEYCNPEKLSTQKNTIIAAIDCCLYLQLHTCNKNYNKLSKELVTLLYQDREIKPEVLEESQTKYIQARFEFLFDAQAASILISSEKAQNNSDIKMKEKTSFSTTSVQEDTGSPWQELLPSELLANISSYSSLADLNSLSRICKFFNSEIQLKLQKIKGPLTEQLLLHVARGKQNAAKAILKNHPGLLLARGAVTDHAGRKFENITAFELAIWNLDTKYMCDMMLKCIPEGNLGKEIKLGLWEQLKSINEKNVNYLLDGENPRTPYYNFDNLTSTLNEYLEMYNVINCSDDELNDYWCKTVCHAQHNAPIQILQHYCEPGVPFDPTPEFNKGSFNRSGIIYNYETGAYYFLKEFTDEGRDTKFGLYRARERCAYCVEDTMSMSFIATWAYLDILALKKLCKVRTADLTSIKTQLSSEVQLLGYEPEKPRDLVY